MGFKVGQKVRLKEGLKPLQKYGNLYFTKFMEFKNPKTIVAIANGMCYFDGLNSAYSFDMVEVVNEPMTIHEIIERNYNATVKRGLITPETSIRAFIEKIGDEHVELFESYIASDKKDFDPKEAVDIIFVCTSLLHHYKYDILKVMEEKTLFNEQRED